MEQIRPEDIREKVPLGHNAWFIVCIYCLVNAREASVPARSTCVIDKFKSSCLHNWIYKAHRLTDKTYIIITSVTASLEFVLFQKLRKTKIMNSTFGMEPVILISEAITERGPRVPLNSKLMEIFSKTFHVENVILLSAATFLFFFIFSYNHAIHSLSSPPPPPPGISFPLLLIAGCPGR